MQKIEDEDANKIKNQNEKNQIIKKSEIITYPNGDKYHGQIINGKK